MNQNMTKIEKNVTISTNYDTFIDKLSENYENSSANNISLNSFKFYENFGDQYPKNCLKKSSSSLFLVHFGYFCHWYLFTL